MKRILLLAALWLGAQTAGAADWRPVIGLTGQGHFPVETTVTPWPGTWYLGGAGTGSQLELGIRNDHHEFYAAWHSTTWMTLEDGNSFMVRTDSATWIASDKQWHEAQKEQRVRIGYRYWPTGAAGWFAPVLGVAVGGGSSRQHTRHYEAITQYHQAASGAAFSTRVFSDESRTTRAERRLRGRPRGTRRGVSPVEKHGAAGAHAHRSRRRPLYGAQPAGRLCRARLAGAADSHPRPPAPLHLRALTVGCPSLSVSFRELHLTF